MMILGGLIDLYSLVVFVAVILSWIPDARDSAFGRWIGSVTEPVFEKIRQVIPPLGGLDLSPMVLLIGLRLVRGLFG
jgi:YggT family protein